MSGIMVVTVFWEGGRLNRGHGSRTLAIRCDSLFDIAVESHVVIRGRGCVRTLGPPAFFLLLSS